MEKYIQWLKENIDSTININKLCSAYIYYYLQRASLDKAVDKMQEFKEFYCKNESIIPKQKIKLYCVDEWISMKLSESGCYSCEIPKHKNGKCKCPTKVCSNCNGYYKLINKPEVNTDPILQHLTIAKRKTDVNNSDE